MKEKQNPMPSGGTALFRLAGQKRQFQSRLAGQPVPRGGTAGACFGSIPVPSDGTSLIYQGVYERDGLTSQGFEGGK